MWSYTISLLVTGDLVFPLRYVQYNTLCEHRHCNESSALDYSIHMKTTVTTVHMHIGTQTEYLSIHNGSY